MEKRPSSGSPIRDDAGGGRRGPRATPSPALFRTIRRRYGIDAAGDNVDLGGSSNLNLLCTRGAVRCVVRVYRRYVTPARLAAIQSARLHLSSNGIPCAELVATRDGQPWAGSQGRLIEVEHFVECQARMNSGERLRVGLPWLGRIHTLLNSLNVGPAGRHPLFANYIAPHQALCRTLQGTQRIRGWDPSWDEARLADEADELAHRVVTADQSLTALLPRQLVHGDYWDNNVFLSKDRVMFVTDFDFMGERARIDDLALTLYFGKSTWSDATLTPPTARRLRTLVAAYEQGLTDPLTSLERATLPVSLARQPLWSIGGWIASLDDEAQARRHAGGMHIDVGWALEIMRNLEQWQAIFA